MQSLKKGQRLKLADVTPSTQFDVHVHAVAPNIIFDVSCFGTNANGRLTDESYFVFYNQKSSPEGALQLRLPEEATEGHSFSVSLDAY
jgi:stress response protein SCP2